MLGISIAFKLYEFSNPKHVEPCLAKTTRGFGRCQQRAPAAISLEECFGASSSWVSS